jgi:signal transduction protein with GAF and PtsI domain
VGGKKVIEKFAEQFAALSDGYLKERARFTRAGPASAVPSR